MTTLELLRTVTPSSAAEEGNNTVGEGPKHAVRILLWLAVHRYQNLSRFRYKKYSLKHF